MIGPEGDFTENEVKIALQKNFKPISLGNNILRTETAAIYTCAVLNYLYS
jgi:16S rRNA (uracil1498-N3)-methyltransferase